MILYKCRVILRENGLFLRLRKYFIKGEFILYHGNFKQIY